MEKDFKKVFAKNLNRLLATNNKTQVDLVNDLNINKSTISTWCNGVKMPRMNKIEQLAAYFGVEKSDLIEEKGEQIIGYYNDPEVAFLANQIKNDPDLRLLLDAKKNLSKEDMESIINITKSLLNK